MSGVNKVIILGRLGNDPEVRTMQNGDFMARISIATSESWTDKQSGEKREQTEWHSVIAFRKLAEIMGQYLKKGAQVYIEGKLRTRKWEAQDGTDRYTTEIIADKLEMLGSAQGNGNNNWATESTGTEKPATNNAHKPTKNQAQKAAENLQTQDEFMDDDIPF